MVDVDTVTYLKDWIPPLILENERKMEATLKPLRDECARFKAISDEALRLRFEAQKLARQNQRDRAGKFGGYSRVEKAQQDAAVDALTAKAADLDRQLGPYAAVAAQLQEAERRLGEARAREEKPVREDHEALRRLDAGLVSIAAEQASLDAEEAKLLQRLDAIKDRRVDLADGAVVARNAWEAAATELKFPGRPTVDLPALPAKPSGQSYVKRYPKSLILGVNATEADVAEAEYREKLAVLK